MADSPVTLAAAAHAGEPRTGDNGLSADPVVVPDWAQLAERFAKDGVHTVEVAFVDTVGVLRGKQIPTRHFLKAEIPQFPFCNAALAWDIQCDLFPGVEFASFDNGYPDVFARPDPSTYAPLPWRPGVAFLLADVYSEHGELVRVAPRYVLKRVLAAAQALGYQVKVGTELEFYLLDADGKPALDGIQCYSLDHAARLAPVLDQVRLALESIGIEVEASGTEYGPAQVEINLAYGEALHIADATFLFKKAVKEIARQHGLIATFMAKPWTGESGSSFHLHQSLWAPDRGTNLFSQDRALALRYASGLVAHARELTALLAPTINSYKRFVPDSFAPTCVSWDRDNRTVATRMLLHGGSGARIEYRSGGADANPYLVVAANIAAGLEGIKHNPPLPEPTLGNAYATPSQKLPSTLSEALDLLESSEVARNAFGQEFVDLFVSVGRHDVTVNQAVVTDWERGRYLETV